ncbi:hypothetical protein [Leptothoe sp. PORK10 BA2]|uniref:hypothetical protein n=1 Tax=Leptothoe sp. PORK10 BA2 TaxID=3110254 RepID=UPI002B21293C|nr:hypothetical protein [Leptothoe sp. PORK10 BA2]MEA5466745.1 hypothetical protein [Leptothoe sp. PORK10 BA2]
MFALWIVLAVLTTCGLLWIIGDRLLQQSLAHEGICPVCNGEGGPCETCNGFGIIVDATKTQSPFRQAIGSPQVVDKVEP